MTLFGFISGIFIGMGICAACCMPWINYLERELARHEMRRV